MENKERINIRKSHSLKRQSKESKLDELPARINKEKEKKGKKKYQNTKCRLNYYKPNIDWIYNHKIEILK